MADENMTQDATPQQKKITVKLKPVALEKATGEKDTAPAEIEVPKAPEGADAAATVKFNKQKVVVSEPTLPTAQDLAKQTIKLSLPPKTGLPKPPPAAPAAAPAEQANPGVTQAIKKPTLKLTPKPQPPAAPATEKAEEAPAAKKPALTLTPRTAPAEQANPGVTQAIKKPTLSLTPKKETAEPLTIPQSAAPAEQAPAAPALQIKQEEKKEPVQDAKKIQEEGLKPKAGGGKGLGLKKVEAVAEEKLPESLKADGEKMGMAAEIKKDKTKKDEPGTAFSIIIILALLLLLAGAYIMFAQYAGLWMPEMDAHPLPVPVLQK